MLEKKFFELSIPYPDLEKAAGNVIGANYSARTLSHIQTMGVRFMTVERPDAVGADVLENIGGVIRETGYLISRIEIPSMPGRFYLSVMSRFSR